MTATFGDFLYPAGQHIAAAVSFRGDLPADVQRAAVGQLGRLVSTMARCYTDLPLPSPPDAARHGGASPAAQATAQARTALQRASRSLRHGGAAGPDAHPVIGHLSAAADHLAAGRDLLHTHFTTGPAGSRAGCSRWAPAIISEPVTGALLSELSEHARTLAPWAAQLTMTGPAAPGMPAPARLILNNAISGLWITAAAAQTALRDHPPPAGVRRLLAAIPANIAPPRRPPGEGEQLPQLCDGLAITAERLRHAALASARRPAAATSASWRHSALASAVTSHANEIILRTLAERADQLRIGPAICEQLRGAAGAMSAAWPAWRAVACEWDILSTGTHRGHLRSPTTADFSDLALRTGRLAYGTQWIPACASASPIRTPADLAPGHGDIKIVVAAVHHAADAISRAGPADRQAVRTAAADRRVYVPTRLMPEAYDIPRPYTCAPHQHTDRLHSAYDTAISASARVTTALDDLAAAIDAPSALLGAVRQFERLHADARQRDSGGQAQQQGPSAPIATPPPDRTQVESLLDSLQITDPDMLLRAAAIDQATRELLTNASATARRREAAAVHLPQPDQTGPGHPARLASKDLPGHTAGRTAQTTRELPTATTPTAIATAASSSTRSRTHGPSRCG